MSVTDNGQTVEKRNSVALAASLFGDDTAGSDIFGILEAPSNAAQPYPGAQNPVDDIFGSNETPRTRSDAEVFFPDDGAASFSSANDLAGVPTEGGPAAYPNAFAKDAWPNGTTGSGTQIHTYSSNYEQWQTPLYDAHGREGDLSPSFGPPYHEVTASQPSQHSNIFASPYQPMNTTSNQPSDIVYDPYVSHSQTPHVPYMPAEPAPPANAYNPFASPPDTHANPLDPLRNDSYGPPTSQSSSYATAQTYGFADQTPTPYHTSYAPVNGKFPLYPASSLHGSAAAGTSPGMIAAAPAAIADVRNFRTSSFDAYDPPIIPTRKSAFRSPPLPTSTHSTNPTAFYNPTVQHPLAPESRYVSPSAVNGTHGHTMSPPAPPPPPRSSYISNLAPTAPPPPSRPPLTPSVPPLNVPPRSPLPRASSIPPPAPPSSSTDGILTSGNGAQGNAPSDEVRCAPSPSSQSPLENDSEVVGQLHKEAPEEATVTLTYSKRHAIDSPVRSSRTVLRPGRGVLDDEDLSLANTSVRTSSWDIEESSMNPTRSVASIDYVVAYPPVADPEPAEEGSQFAESSGHSFEVSDIEGDSTVVLGASAVGSEAGSNDVAPSSDSYADSGDHEVPFGLQDTESIAPSLSQADVGTNPSVPYNPYAPSVTASGPPPAAPRVPSPPKRAISDSPSPYIPSVYSFNADHYAPPPPPRKPSLNIEPPTASNMHSHYQPPPETFVPPALLYEPSSLGPPPPSSTYSSSPSQPSIYSLPVPHISASHEVSPVMRSVYAPSPSQSAADDPRTTTRIPIFNFGFGGRMVTCFHSRTDVNAGFDVALAGRPSDLINIRSMKSVTSESHLQPSVLEFPGPLFTGNISPTIGLGRATGTQSSAVKNKKTAVLKYINERADELEKGLGYLSSTNDDAERRSTEGRVVLLRLLAVMVDNDGKLSGTPELAEQIRKAILPANGVSFLKGSTSSSPTAATGFSGPASETFNETREQPLATYQVRASSLDRLQALLLSGKRREACHYALDQKLWAHAMVISNSIDKEMRKDVVNEFIRTELGIQTSTSAALTLRPDLVSASATQETTNGRESLRVLYSLFCGQGTAAVQELLPPKNLANVGESTHLAPHTIQATPISPNFPKPALTAHIPPGVLSKWPETAASIVSNADGAAEHHAALTTLGDYLISNNWVEAAHACYLLSMKTSPLGGVGAPSVRLTLIGSNSPGLRRNFHLDIDAIRYTEVVEFALSLVPPVKEPFSGLLHLQPYKLLRAWQLAELGLVKEATKYCEAITTILKANPRGSPFFTLTFLELHQELSGRLAGTADKNSSWISRTIKTPSMDSLSSWSLNKLTKFIEGDEPSPIPEETLSNEQTTVGPFSHYSEISSATTSQLPSPNGSVKGMSLADGGSPSGPPKRSGSAMGSRAPVAPPPDRSASAMGFVRPSRNSPPGRNWSAGPGTTTFPQSTNRSDPDGPKVFTPQPDSRPSHNSGWWSSANGDIGKKTVETDPGATPTATFFQPNESADAGNFVSLMDSYSPTHTPTLAAAPGSTAYSSRYTVQEVEEDDLGLGNTSHKHNKPPGTSRAASTTSAAEKITENEEAKQEVEKSSDSPATTPKGWFSWWGGTKSDKPKPVRANLGEAKSSFYYDKELKRWVNGKEGGSVVPAPASPPPPSRAQTASPSKMGGVSIASAAPPPPNSSTPPPRAQSSMGLTTGPPRFTPPGSLRAPSGLSESFVPPSSGEQVGAPLASPGPPRAKSAQGQRRNARARYVDVFANPPPPS